MIEIRLTDRYRLTADSRQWIIQRLHRREDKAGNPIEVWDGVSFHSTVEQAFQSLHKKLLRGTDANTLPELLENSERIVTLLSGSYTDAKTLDRSTEYE